MSVQERIRLYILFHYITESEIKAWYDRPNYLFLDGKTPNEMIQDGKEKELLAFVIIAFNYEF